MAFPPKCRTRRWDYTWEALSHIRTLRLFLSSPDLFSSPSLHCRNLQASLLHSSPHDSTNHNWLVRLDWIETHTEKNLQRVEDGKSTDDFRYELRVPLPKALLVFDPDQSLQFSAEEDHIRVKISLLFPVDHPLDFEEENGGDFDSKHSPLSVEDDVKRLNSLGEVHLYCNNCSTRLTKEPLRSFMATPSTNWRDVADNWFGSCCCSFGVQSEILASAYENSFVSDISMCLVDVACLIVSMENLLECVSEKYGWQLSRYHSKFEDRNITNNSNTNVKDVKPSCGITEHVTDKDINIHACCSFEPILGRESTDCLVELLPTSNGTSIPNGTNIPNGTHSLDDKLNSYYDLGTEFNKLHICTDNAPGHGHCGFVKGPTSVAGRTLATDSTNSRDGVHVKPNGDRFSNGSFGNGFIVGTSNNVKGIEWVEFSCSNCSSLAGSFPSTGDHNMPLDGGIRFFKCHISTSATVDEPDNVFRRHTLQRLFSSQLLESAADELSYRTIIMDIDTKVPMLQLVLLNTEAWCCSGHLLDEVDAKSLVVPLLLPMVKVLYSECSNANRTETGMNERWKIKNQVEEFYMVNPEIQNLVKLLGLSNAQLPSSCSSMQGQLMSFIQR